MKKRNLRKLANYLLNLPEGYKHFDMETLCSTDKGAFDDSPLAVKAVIESCGTTACALGHAPTIRGFEPEDGEDWEEYCERMFGLEFNENDWEWCFGTIWEGLDNSPLGAALRIFYLLDFGAPDRWDYDEGQAVPLYTNAYEVS